MLAAAYFRDLPLLCSLIMESDGNQLDIDEIEGLLIDTRVLEDRNCGVCR